ncbi:MAG: CoA transferase [Burkholderiaceae bacterium]|nr:CoA transferase [Burkholderiaceae bacterium]
MLSYPPASGLHHQREEAPLAGVRVLDFSRLLPGPFCSQVLADLGAEVIRIDDATREDGGDLMRKEAAVEGFGGGEFFHQVNRDKQSVALNLRDSRAVDIVKRLVVGVDLVLEGFRPGVMDRLGVGYAALSSVRPSLVYCAISGFGQTGSYAAKAGHDLNYQALSGTLHHNATRGGQPAISGLQTADLAGGAMTAITAMLAALLKAKTTGQGRFLDVSMTDGLMALNVYLLGLLSLEGREPTPGAGLITGGAACYQVYATADGRWLAVGALEQKFWARFCEVIGRPDLCNSGHLLGDAGRQVIEQVSRAIGAEPLSYWSKLFDDQDCCVTPVMTLAEAITHGPSAGRGFVHLNAYQQPRFSFPVSMVSSEVAQAQALAELPEIGAHTRRILHAADYGPAEIDAFMRDGVVR